MEKYPYFLLLQRVHDSCGLSLRRLRGGGGRDAISLTQAEWSYSQSYFLD
jgi:hypothetical protein